MESKKSRDPQARITRLERDLALTVLRLALVEDRLGVIQHGDDTALPSERVMVTVTGTRERTLGIGSMTISCSKDVPTDRFEDGLVELTQLLKQRGFKIQ